MPAMALLHKKTLVIELGIGCNNRCLFCYQRGYREVWGYPKWMTASEVRSRLRWGVEHGYDEVSFTGGEPTIRPDFLDLVRFAREVGFRRVAVTTNGWKLGDEGFFRDAVQAGLTSMGVSIHGPDARTHEGLTGRPGSFARAVQAIRNAVRTHGSDRVVRLNTFTLVNRQNVDRLVDLAVLLHQLGVRLLVFQPIILSKANFETAADLMVGLADTVRAVRDVVREGIRLGFRTKLFNLPPCLFREVLPGIDLDHYERATFREHDDARPSDRSLGDEVGLVRLAACRECVLQAGCPGVHVTLLPQEDLVARFEEAVEAWSPSGPWGDGRARPLWIAGLDLVRPSGVYRVVRKARLAGFEDIRVTHGGASLGGRAFVTAAVEAGASEVVFVHHGADPRSADRIVSLAGNDRFLVRALHSAIDEVRRGPARIGLVVSADRRGLAFLCSADLSFLAACPPVLHVRHPFLQDSHGQPLDEFRLFVKGLSGAAFPVSSVVLEVAWPWTLPDLALLPMLAAMARGKVRFDLSARVLATPFLDPRVAVLNWSDPRLGRSPAAPGDGAPIVSRVLRVKPLDAQSLAARSVMPERSAPTPGGMPRDPETGPQ